MLNLYLDASTKYMIIILEKDNLILAKINQNNFQKHSENYIETVFNDILKKHNFKINDLDNVYTTIGPGSYVGVRIVLVFVKMLKMIYPKIKVFTINSLLAQVETKHKTISLLMVSNSVNYFQTFLHFKAIDEIQKCDILTVYKLLENKDSEKVIDFQSVHFIDSFTRNCKKYGKLIKNIQKIDPIYLTSTW
ncbi:hypothetical protein [Mycoplasma sp. SG1]|uniref:hypothetical protein n=1 Tax=Mycoplasma sp. SG1 TaxID=2810348 RepID=UPI0020250E2B|nr:hypothetical protein [Mycoplasma sp. SG1]URM52948.1 hypothetical protein JRW51_01210 [Mycoplasma sp. SG1]